MIPEFDIREAEEIAWRAGVERPRGRSRRRQIAATAGEETRISAPACIQQALAEVMRTADAGSEFIPDPAVQTTSSGARVVHLHQQFRGVPVFQGRCTVRFEPAGDIEAIADETWRSDEAFEVTPTIKAAAAARTAAAYVSAKSPEETPKRHRYRPRILASFPHPSRPTVLSRGPFADPVTAHLVIFPVDGTAHLAWWLTVKLRQQIGEYDLLVAADGVEPEVLYCKSLLCSVRAVGNVFVPFPPPGGFRIENFPRPLAGLPRFIRPLPSGFPAEWVDRDTLKGNCTFAFLDATGEKTFRGAVAGGVLSFQPNPANSDDQKLVNAFYFCNLMHDFFLGLGFDDAAGNFQNVNRVGAGIGGDCVIARVLDVAIEGLATMRSRPDGKNGHLSLGPVLNGGHTALDPDFVIHEFTHGVTERVVGGPMDFRSLEKPQSVALAEGWSDYFALTFQSYGGTEKVIFGDWATRRPGGLRSAPYNDNFRRGFGDLGRAPFDRPPVCGEIWCATLMRMNREIGKTLGDARFGHMIGWQIVFDGLKKLQPNPNFLQARDAIFIALTQLRDSGLISAAAHDRVAPAVRSAFAAHGMGPGARANGTSLTGNTAG
ncbi:MAG TPA: M36 family metallopeptidase [Chloroflexia bacterium]|jgi:extracellular elastinolytic metalloproteinase